MSVRSALLRLARRVVENVMSQLMQNLNVVEEQSLNPMRTMVQSVVDGIWTGNGANAFVDEVSNMMIPGVGQVMDNIQRTHDNISHAVNVIDRADEEVNQLIGSRLVDSFAFY